jgi:ABC-type branched-subunit amino acid transport system ATPase component/branched-subunit amino acid ABC-type transport system permease component
MTEYLPFIVAGLVSGVIYGLSGTSLVLTYKTSGIFNFGQGAMATVGAYVFYYLWIDQQINWVVSLIIVLVVVGPVMGLAMERMARRLSHQRSEWKIVGTIGLVLLVQGIGSQWYGTQVIPVPQFLPGATDSFTLFEVHITGSQVIVILIALVIMLALLAMFRFTRMGVSMRAVVENPDLADVQGVSPVRVRRVAWVLGSSIVVLSGVLLLPLIGLDSIIITLLVVDTFAAAAIGRFDSIPLAFVGGLLVGIGGSLLTKFELTNTFLLGASEALPFAVLLVVMLVIPKRRLQSPTTHEERPALLWKGPPRLRGSAYVLVFAFLLTVPLWVPAYLLTPYWSGALIQAILILSLGLLVRSAGIVSLCTTSFAAFGAVAFSHLFVGSGLPWVLAVLLSGVIAIPIGALVALPAIRLSSLFLTLGTFGFALLVQQLLYPRSWMFTLLATGRQTPRPSWATSDQSFYYLVFGFFVLMVGLVGAINRARLGRVMRGISDSAKAVSVLGLNVQATRVLVFSISAFMAAVAGSLHGALLGTVNGGDPFFTPFNSIILLAVLALSPFRVPWYAIFAGLTSVIPGYFTGGGVTNYMNIIFGVSAIVIAAQGGPAQMPIRLQRILESRFGRAAPELVADPSVSSAEATDRAGVAVRAPAARTGLNINGLGVRFGGLVAVEGVSLEAPVGRITGLIGPNGAGKTTIFDACSGLNSPSQGEIKLNGSAISKLPPDARARHGLGRTFQVMELCDSLTVAENVALGWEASRAGRSWRTQLAARKDEDAARRRAAAGAMNLCGIADVAARQAGSLSTGQRRLVDLARALAGPFDVLLLDEPSSGLGPEETERFAEVLRRVVAERGCGILLVEHDMSLVMNVCDYIYVLDFGRSIFEGTPAAVAASEVVQTAYLGETSAQEGTTGVLDLANTVSGNGLAADD